MSDACEWAGKGTVYELPEGVGIDDVAIRMNDVSGEVVLTSA